MTNLVDIASLLNNRLSPDKIERYQSVEEVSGELTKVNSSNSKEADSLESKNEMLYFISVAPLMSEFIKIINGIYTSFRDTQRFLLDFLGSAGKTRTLMKGLLNLALNNPFNFSELASACHQLINEGTEPERVIAILHELSNTAFAKKQTLSTSVEAYLQDQNRDGSDHLHPEYAAIKDPHTQELPSNLLFLQNDITQAFSDIEQKYLEMGLTGNSNELGNSYHLAGKTITRLSGTYGPYKTAIALINAAENEQTFSQLANYHFLFMQKNKFSSLLKKPFIVITTTLIGLVTTLWAPTQSSISGENA